MIRIIEIIQRCMLCLDIDVSYRNERYMIFLDPFVAYDCCRYCVKIMINSSLKSTKFKITYLYIFDAPSVIEEIWILKDLKYLEISNTPINFIPETINLINLTSLILENNKLFEFPISFATCSELDIIAITDNYITYLPRFILNFRYLDTFVLNSNLIHSINREILELEALETLDLGNNPLSDQTLELMRRFEDEIYFN